MDADERARIERLERQVAYLLTYLGQDAEVAARPTSSFGSPDSIFGVPSAPAPWDAPPAEPAYPPSAYPPPPAYPSASAYPPAIDEYLARGQKISAIKAYREWSGLGLKEAKQVIDELDRQRGGGGRRR